MAKRRRQPPAPEPYRAAILAVDTAEVSGWALWQCGELVGWGEIAMMDPRANPSALKQCCEVVEGAAALGIDAVLVYEQPFRGTNQGQWRGNWKAAWGVAGGSSRRVVGVYPATWRARVLGRGMHAARREVVRPVERAVATAIAGARPGDIGPDAAPAICIGAWAVRAPQVGAKLPKRAKPAERRRV